MHHTSYTAVIHSRYSHAVYCQQDTRQPISHSVNRWRPSVLSTLRNCSLRDLHTDTNHQRVDGAKYCRRGLGYFQQMATPAAPHWRESSTQSSAPHNRLGGCVHTQRERERRSHGCPHGSLPSLGSGSARVACVTRLLPSTAQRVAVATSVMQIL